MSMCTTMVNPERTISVIQIPKNASTRFRILKEPQFGHNWTIENVQEPGKGALLDRNIRTVIILRDPKDRYMSALNMFCKVKGNLFQMPITWKGYLDNDQHFMTQKRYVDVFGDFVNKDFWWFKPGVAFDISEHYGLGLNQSTVHSQTEKIITDVNQEWINEQYADDYALINSVRFLNK